MVFHHKREACKHTKSRSYSNQTQQPKYPVPTQKFLTSLFMCHPVTQSKINYNRILVLSTRSISDGQAARDSLAVESFLFLFAPQCTQRDDFPLILIKTHAAGENSSQITE